MSVFNRIVASLFFIVLLLAILFFAVFPAEAVIITHEGAAWLEWWVSRMASSAYENFVLIRIGLVLASALVFGFLLWLEVRRPARRDVRIETQSGAQVALDTNAVTQRLTWHIDQLPGVIHVKPKISPGKENIINLRLDLETSPEIDVPTKTDEVISVARQVIQDRMGLTMGTVDVKIRHAPYPQAETTFNE